MKKLLKILLIICLLLGSTIFYIDGEDWYKSFRYTWRYDRLADNVEKLTQLFIEEELP